MFLNFMKKEEDGRETVDLAAEPVVLEHEVHAGGVDREREGRHGSSRRIAVSRRRWRRAT